MNKVILMGRLTRDPDVRYGAGGDSAPVVRYTLAVDRRVSRRDSGDSQQPADFIGCVVFGKGAEFAEKYLRQGTKVVVTGRLQTGSYINHEGQKVYTTDVVVEDQEFAESKAADSGRASGTFEGGRGDGHSGRASGTFEGGRGSGAYGSVSGRQPQVDAGGFLRIPEGGEDDLPFN